jgi:hypothetical protein
MTKYKENGDIGEKEIVEKVKCPNCSKSLMKLPTNYHLYDVQCVGCNFKAQVKTNNSRPSNIIHGAGWDIIEKVLKSGFLLPPLIVNFKWIEKGVKKQEIRFYPFIKKVNLKKYTANIKSDNRLYRMFNYDLKDAVFEIILLR